MSRAPLVAAGAVALLLVGVALGYFARGSGSGQPAAPALSSQRSSPPVSDDENDAALHENPQPGTTASNTPGEVVVTLSPEMVTRAGIRTARATPGTAAAQLRLPGIVQPNAYREVMVTSLVPGRVTQVHAELGAAVAAQDPLATVYSPDLAEAQTAFIAARAELLAHQQRQTRTQRLTAIGAATREELEMHEAERARIEAAVEIARSRLALLGIPEERTQRLAGPQDVVTTTEVRTPLAGVVTQRAANVGLNIDPSTPLFTVVDLSTVWVIADLYERDFAKVRVGSAAEITTSAYPGVTLRGRVGYIDPRLQQETRTAKLRIEVPNGQQRLRLGMYVDALVGDASTQEGVLVPAAAIQVVGADSVVFVAGSDSGRFVERKVDVGGTAGGQTLVRSGLEPGEQVVTDGVFFLRAERERAQSR